MMSGDPIEPRKHAGERTREARHIIRNDRQTESRQTPRIAIGVQDEPCALRPHGLDHALQDGPAPNPPQTLVAAAHAAREAPGEENPERVTAHQSYSAAAFAAARVTFTAQNLNSGIFPNGSSAGLVRRFAAAST